MRFGFLVWSYMHERMTRRRFAPVQPMPDFVLDLQVLHRQELIFRSNAEVAFVLSRILNLIQKSIETLIPLVEEAIWPTV